MKKNITIIMVMVLSLSIIVYHADVLINTADGFSFGIYPLCGIVIEVNYEEDYITIEDFYGNIWIFEGIEDWAENDVVAMIMDDHGTERIEDDIIIDLRYCGTIED